MVGSRVIEISVYDGLSRSCIFDALLCIKWSIDERLIDFKSGTVRRRRFFHNTGKFSGKVTLVCKSGCVADLSEGHGGLQDFVAGFLHLEVADVVFG